MYNGNTLIAHFVTSHTMIMSQPSFDNTPFYAACHCYQYGIFSDIIFRVQQNSSLINFGLRDNVDYSFYMYVGKNHGNIIASITGCNIYGSDGITTNQTFTWDGAISSSAPLLTSYIDTGIYKMFSERQPPQIADIASLQSTLSTYMTQTQATSLLGNYYTQGQIDDTIDQKYNFILNGGASTQ